jgi:hypothetical protein
MSGVGTDTPYPTQEYEEPETPYDPKYPYNHVYQSESGHYIEIDDTPEKQRLHTYHKAGTFHEIHPNGTEVNKVRRLRYDFIIHDFYQTSYKSVNITAGKAMRLQSGEEMNIHSCGDMNRDTEKNLNTIVRVDANTRIENDENTVVDVDRNEKIKHNKSLIVERDVHTIVKHNVLTEVGNDLRLHVKGDLTLQVDGNLKIAVGGFIATSATLPISISSTTAFSLSTLGPFNISSILPMFISSLTDVGIQAGLRIACSATMIHLPSPTYGSIFAYSALVANELGPAVSLPAFPPIPLLPIPVPPFYFIDVKPEDPELAQSEKTCG